MNLAAEELNIPSVPTSALTGDGIASLREKIVKLATGGAVAEPGLLTNLRQQQSIGGCNHRIGRCRPRQ